MPPVIDCYHVLRDVPIPAQTGELHQGDDHNNVHLMTCIFAKPNGCTDHIHFNVVVRTDFTIQHVLGGHQQPRSDHEGGLPTSSSTANL